MARLVVDSSVVVKWFLPEALADKAAAILDDYRNGITEFTVPDLLFAEVGNIAWKKQSLHRLPPQDIARMLLNLQQIQFDVLSSRDLLDEAFQLAVQHQRTAYDSLYLAASIRLGCPFISADERLVNAVSGVLPNIEWLGSR